MQQQSSKLRKYGGHILVVKHKKVFPNFKLTIRSKICSFFDKVKVNFLLAISQS